MLKTVMAALVSALILSQQPAESVKTSDLPKPGATPTTTAPAPVAERPQDLKPVKAKVIPVAPPAPTAPSKKTAAAAENEPVETPADSQPQPDFLSPPPQAQPTVPPAAQPAPKIAQAPAARRSLRDEPRPATNRPVAAFWMILPGQSEQQ